MKNFVSDMIEFAFESVGAYKSTSKEAEKIGEFLGRLFSDDGDIKIEEYIEMYDTRIYNFDSKRSDIKIMKRFDFEGAYILYNSTKNTYYSGYSGKVLRKINRLFSGNENTKVNYDWKSGDKIFIRVKPYKSSEESNVQELEKKLIEVYEKRVFDENIRREQEERDILEKQRLKRIKEERRKQRRINFVKRYWKKIISLIGIFLLMLLLSYIYTELKKYRPIGYDSSNLIGLEYKEVGSKLCESGFENISYESIDDLKIDDIKRENTVANIKIGEVENFSSSKKFYDETKIIIQYHTLEKIPIPLDSDDIIGENFNEIVKVLKSNGFVKITVEPLNNLILGWLHSDGEVESITVNGIDTFQNGRKFRPDVEIIIKYHSFE